MNHYCLKYSNLEDQMLFGCLCIDFTLDWLIPFIHLHRLLFYYIVHFQIVFPCFILYFK